MKKLMVAPAAIGMLSLFTTASWAFWSLGIPVHADITKEALSGSFAFNSNTYTFTPRAIALIITANRNQDITQVNDYQAVDHFDSGLLKASTDLLVQRIADLESTLGEPAPDPQIVMQYLGQITHAAQDFYAHSSWVANGNSAIVNFSDPAFTGSAIYAAFTDQSAAAVCDSTFANLLTNGAHPITTGYYTPLTTPTGQCDHGWRSKTPSMVADALAGACAVNLTKDGINHDNACFDSDDDVSIFEGAYALAVQETTAIVTTLVSDLQASGNTTGFCLLLGLNEAQAPCNFSATADATSQSLQIGTAMTPFAPLTASGGFPPYTYTIKSGTLPEGLSLNSTTGVVSGTPTSLYPTSSITFDVRDSVGDYTIANMISAVDFTVADVFSPTIVSGTFSSVGFNYGTQVSASDAGTFTGTLSSCNSVGCTVSAMTFLTGFGPYSTGPFGEVNYNDILGSTALGGSVGASYAANATGTVLCSSIVWTTGPFAGLSGASSTGSGQIEEYGSVLVGAVGYISSSGTCTVTVE